MEMKDNQLKTRGKGDTQGPSDSKRSQKPKTSQSDGPQDNAMSERIKGHEFEKWEKFDVDKALSDIDKVPKIQEIFTDEPVETPEQLRQRAVAEKDRGNEHFREGNYDAAIECYTRGIQCDPCNPMLPANRAMAAMKLGRFAEAETDCTLAISLDPTYVKAIHRRATIRSKLKRVSEALEDYEKILKLEPKNKQAKLEMNKLREDKNKESSSKKEPITTKSDQSFNDNIKAAFTKSKPVKVERVPSNLELPIASNFKLEPGQVLPIEKLPHQRSKKALKRIIIREEEEDMPKSPPVVLSTGSEEAGETCEVSKMETDQVQKTAIQTHLEEDISKRLEAAHLKSLPGKPKTAVKFSSTWARLPLPMRVDYLRQLQESDYPKIFKNSLEPSLFSEIIQALNDPRMTGCSYSHIVGLSRVPRISALIMFASKEEKEIIRHILESIKKETISSKVRKQLDFLAKLFDVK